MVHRIAALHFDSCHSRKCQQECIRFCPVNITDGECIVLGDNAKAVISEELCTGCGICIKKCPFEAISILNLAEELKVERIHQYGINTFRLYRLPIPKKGTVVGLVGRNGIGKTTAMNILAGNLKPNLGNWEDPPDWDQIMDVFQGTELKTHFEAIVNGELKVAFKPQAVFDIPKFWSGDTISLLRKYDERGVVDKITEDLHLEGCLERKVGDLSGGELQRLAVAIAASREADFYFFDEPSSYNDIFQRLAVSSVIRELAEEGKYVMLIEHDLTFLDYMSDFIHVLYGDTSVYGTVTGIYAARTGINILLDGYIPNENVKFRDNPVVFDKVSTDIEDIETSVVAKYPNLVKKYEGFQLEIESGSLKEGEIIGVLGANALGKTTFMKMISGVEKPDSGNISSKVSVSYKPQYLSNEYGGLVEEFFDSRGGLKSSPFHSQLFSSLGINRLMDKKISELSGGELQKIAIASCLMIDADVYALDEPSAFIDIENRISLGKTIHRFIKAYGKSALIVDHDLQLIDIISDTIMIFSGKSAVNGHASSPLPKSNAMNSFLGDLGITYRRDHESGRPRVNKFGSKLDRDQKETGSYYYLSSFNN